MGAIYLLLAIIFVNISGSSSYWEKGSAIHVAKWVSKHGISDPSHSTQHRDPIRDSSTLFLLKILRRGIQQRHMEREPFHFAENVAMRGGYDCSAEQSGVYSMGSMGVPEQAEVMKEMLLVQAGHDAFAQSSYTDADARIMHDNMLYSVPTNGQSSWADADAGNCQLAKSSASPFSPP